MLAAVSGDRRLMMRPADDLYADRRASVSSDIAKVAVLNDVRRDDG